jgi:hypothetical protein
MPFIRVSTEKPDIIVGCYNNTLVRVLPFFMSKSDEMTLDQCRSTCQEAEYTFAGVEVSCCIDPRKRIIIYKVSVVISITIIMGVDAKELRLANHQIRCRSGRPNLIERKCN